jgi:hypothetical protein
MNISSSLSIALSCLATLAVAGCSGAPDRTTTSTSSAALTSSAGAEPALSGTWVFVLDASEVGTKVRSDCDAKAGGNAKKSAECFEEVRAEGATEKLRFARQPDGKTLWTSYSQNGTGEELFLEVPLEVSAESATRLVGKVAGAPRGKQAAEVAEQMPVGTSIPFELVDDHTLVMPDPHKGRLVFHKE